MKPSEAAKQLGVADGTVYRYIRDGELVATRNGRQTDITPEELERFKNGTQEFRKGDKKPEEYSIPTWDVWQQHPIRNITPDKAFNIMVESEYGELFNIADLYDDMVERDPVINSLIGTRKAQVTKLNWDVLPLDEYDEDEKAAEQVDFVKMCLNELSASYLTGADAAAYLSFDDLMEYLLDGIPRPFSTAAILWDTEKKWKPIAAKSIHMRHFRIGIPGEDFNPNELRIKTEKSPSDGEPVPPYSYLTHYSRGNAYLTRRGILRSLIWAYLFKYHGTKWFLRYAEIASVPFRLAEYDTNSLTWQEDLRKMLVGLRDMGDQGFAALPKGSSFQFVDAGRASATANPPQQLIDFCDKMFTKAFLGQEGTTEATPGKLGDMKEQENVQTSLATQDAKALMSTINRGLIAPICQFNFGKVMCKFVIDYEPGKDVKTQMEIIKIASELISIPESHIQEVSGIPPVVDGEPATTVKTASPSLGFERFELKKKVNAAVNQSRTQRLQRAERIRTAMDEIEKRCVSDSLPIYDKLTAGLTEKNYETELNKRKEAFKKDFEAVIEPNFSEFYGKVDTEYSGKVKNAVNITWDLAEQDAADFFNWQTFTMSQLEGELITEELKKRIGAGVSQAIEKGTTFKDFLNDVKNSVGIGNAKPYHLETVFRTNMSTAHSAATYSAMKKYGYTAWEFLGVDDADTTEYCLPNIGKVFSADKTDIMPPRHHRCRSEASPITPSELEAEGYEMAEATGGAAPGFKNFAITNYNAWVKDAVASLPEGVRGTVEDKIMNELERLT